MKILGGDYGYCRIANGGGESGNSRDDGVLDSLSCLRRALVDTSVSCLCFAISLVVVQTKMSCAFSPALVP